MAEPRPAPGRTSFGQEKILQKIREWAERFGEAPRAIDWDPSRARRKGQLSRVERFESDAWPTARIVARRFGTFNAAVAAAGFVPSPAPSRQRPNVSDDRVILDAIVAWAIRYGEPPTQADWDPPRARRLRQEWRIARYYDGDWPSLRTVISRFGTLSEAIRRAGLVPRVQGQHGRPAASLRPANRRTLAELQGRGATVAGPGVLRRRIAAVVAARDVDDDHELRASLVALAAAALEWADDLEGWSGRDAA